MPLALDTIFPDHAVWPFIERNSGAQVKIALTSSTEPGKRHLALNDPANNPTQAFFDRMTVTAAGLELNRVRLLHQTLDLRIPLTIAYGNGVDKVADLFPNISGTFPLASPPYDGTVTKISGGTTSGDFASEVRIVSHSREGVSVFDARYRFSPQGIVSYVGQVYGVFFVYQRTDIAVPPHAA